MASILGKFVSPTKNAESSRPSLEDQKALLEADRARDARQWDHAVLKYQQYLTGNPDDQGIWVQLGHALKESKQFEEAERAYTRSMDLSPDVADTHLQLGHLYKRMNTLAKAISAYQAALRIDPQLFDAKRELEALGIATTHLASQAQNARNAGIFIDLSDVFFYLRHHSTVSGIQRVQFGIAKAIIEMAEGQRAGIWFITETSDRSSYTIIDDVFLALLWNELSNDIVSHERLLALMSSAVAKGSHYMPVPGDTILILGAFWVLENVAERIIALRRDGIHVGALVHDIIPITHPEFCEKSLTDAFRSYFVSVLSVVEFILTVSDHSGGAVRAFLERHKLNCPPMKTLRLAHKTWEPSNRNLAQTSREILQLLKQDYVLYVSTIEIRKNHTYLFRIWKRLLESRGRSVPTLVFVGRPGWRVDDLMAQLRSTGNLNGRIKILHDLSDAELAALYRSARFTVFPSFEEGWGLPVGESLIFGRPCIASNTSSIPEVAGDFVDYIDPFNEKDGFGKIAAFIDNPSLVDARAATIATKFKPRVWTDVAEDLIAAVKSLTPVDRAATPVPLPLLKSGVWRRVGHRNSMSEFIDSGDAAFAYAAFDTHWYPVEQFGRWLRGGWGRVTFSAGAGSIGPGVFAIELCAVGWLGDTKLAVTVNDKPFAPLALSPGKDQTVFLRVSSDSDAIALDFEALGVIARHDSDPRSDLCFGIKAIAYAKADDPLGRLSLLESLFISSGLAREAVPVAY